MDYRDVLASQTAGQIAKLSQQGLLDKALLLGRSFESELFPSSLVLYEMALAANRAGQLDQALKLYNELLTKDPHMPEALYDRGEILLARGEWEQAQADLKAVLDLRPDHWVIHFRLAEVAGQKGDALELEARLIQALKFGFSLQTLLKSGEHWLRWSQDPVLSRPIRRVITMYGDEEIWRLLQQH